jgi:hypothetical protein
VRRTVAYWITTGVVALMLLGSLSYLTLSLCFLF